MSKVRQYVRVRLVPMKDTSLICAGCGGFHCDIAIAVKNTVCPEYYVGLHKGCIELVTAKSTRARAIAPKLSPEANDPEQYIDDEPSGGPP